MIAPPAPRQPAPHQVRRATDALQAGRERFAAGAVAESIALFRSAADARTDAFGESDPRTIDALRQLAAALAAAGVLPEAAALLERIAAASGGAASRVRARRVADLEAHARVLTRQRAWATAEPVLRALLRECRAVHGSAGETTLWALMQLGTSWQQLGRPAAAERCWARVLRHREATDAAPALVAALRERLAECAEAQARPAEALTLRLQASRVRSGGQDAPPARVAPAAPAPLAAAATAAAASTIQKPLADAALRTSWARAGEPLRSPAPDLPAPRILAVTSSIAIATRQARLRRGLTLAAVIALAAAGVWSFTSRGSDVEPMVSDAAADSTASRTPLSLGAPSTEVYEP